MVLSSFLCVAILNKRDLADVKIHRGISGAGRRVLAVVPAFDPVALATRCNLSAASAAFVDSQFYRHVSALLCMVRLAKFVAIAEPAIGSVIPKLPAVLDAALIELTPQVSKFIRRGIKG